MGQVTVLLIHVASAEAVVETVLAFRNTTFAKAEPARLLLVRSRTHPLAAQASALSGPSEQVLVSVPYGS